MHDAIRPLNVAAASTPSGTLGTVFHVEMRSTKVTERARRRGKSLRTGVYDDRVIFRPFLIKWCYYYPV